MGTIKTIDLFAGIGGIRKGFEQTGKFETVYSNDFDKHAKLTYDKNFDDVKMSLKDLRNVHVAGEIPQFDIMLGGFPCQPFSIGGHGMGFNDRKGRGTLFEEIVRILKEAEEVYGELPMGFMLENVKNLKSHDGGRTYQIIHDSLEELGYHIDAKVYNSLSFGVAQSRERIYIVGFRDERLLKSFSWPDAKYLPEQYVKVKQILDKNIEPRFYYEGKPLFEKIGHLVTDEDCVYQYRRNYVRVQKLGYAPTLVASMGLGGHNVPIVKDARGMRKLTPAECAKLQGYYDLHIPVGMSDQQIYKQIGNSVSVPVIQAIAGKMAEAIEEASAPAPLPAPDVAIPSFQAALA